MAHAGTGPRLRHPPDGPWRAAASAEPALAASGVLAADLAATGPGLHLELPPLGAGLANLPALLAALRATPDRAVALDGPGAPRAWLGAGPPAAPTRYLGGALHPTTALLDRDGTINLDRHYLADPAGVELLPGAAPGLRRLQNAGLALVVITNQSGVAAGRITPPQLAAVRARLEALLGDAGVRLTGTYACTHGPDDGCPCRKPSDRLARQAAAEHRLDLTRSVVVGDKASDLALGRRLGVPTFLVTSGYGQATLAAREVLPDFVVDDLEALARICTHPAGIPRAATPSEGASDAG